MVKKITFVFSDFNTMFTKFSSLNFEEKAVQINCIFQFNGPPKLHQKGHDDIIHSRAFERSVCDSG